MDAIPTERPKHRADAIRRLLAIIVSAGAVMLLLAAAFWPIFERRPPPPYQALILLAAAAVVGAQVGGRGTRLAFTLLWGTLGIALAAGTAAVFSFGIVVLPAAVLIALLLVVTPNRSELASRADWRLGAAFCVGYAAAFWPIWALLSRLVVAIING